MASIDLGNVVGKDGAPGKNGAVAQNLFDNSNFMINQRGETSYTGKAYTVDRWAVAVREATVNVVPNGITFTLNDSTGSSYLEQRVLPEKIKLGKTYTVAAFVDGEVICGSFTYNGETNGSTLLVSIGKTLMCVYFYTAYQAFRIGFSDVNVAHTIEWAALYEGEYTVETLQPYVPKPFVTELLECQRYYFQCGSDWAFYGYIGTRTNKAYINILLPVDMRITPTATLHDGYIRLYINGAAQDVTSIDSVKKITNTIELCAILKEEVQTRIPISGWVGDRFSLSADL